MGLVRLARIAHPEGVAFVSVDGDGDSNDTMVSEIADHPFGTPNYTGRKWPLSDVRLDRKSVV